MSQWMSKSAACLAASLALLMMGCAHPQRIEMGASRAPDAQRTIAASPQGDAIAASLGYHRPQASPAAPPAE